MVHPNQEPLPRLRAGSAGVPVKYARVSFWLDLLFKRGSLFVAEVMGTLFLLRTLTSLTFTLGPAILGAFLLTFGITVEYLMWRQTGTLFSMLAPATEVTEPEQPEQ